MFRLPDLYYSDKTPVFYEDNITYEFKYSKNILETQITFGVDNLTGDEYNYTPAYHLNLPESINGIDFKYDEVLRGNLLPDRVKFISRKEGFNLINFEGNSKNNGFQELVFKNEDLDIIIRNKKNSKYKIIIEKVD